ncbi:MULTISPECIES: SPFH domain-containing protein [Actinosynnema]|uniref:SPFH domain-containing protein n=1 Tax=Actinosynnema TaxID=40566 RepID=UPI0020A495D8|nr:SPFH domain-containing protein [Actinosynnema pretiosum]MCP2093300.1 SPFH domain / Band 7 family protein [Actinosynnema pretiosum]
MKVTVMPWHRAARFRDGEHVGELGPGKHRVGRRDSLQRIDTRLQTSTPSAQDIPTADGVHVRVTPALTCAVVDASRYVPAADSPTQVLHLACQLRLRAAIAEITARAEGRAALERARGETAALRSLLNAARLAEEHPVLLQLRSLQNAQTVVVEQSGAPRRSKRAKREATGAAGPADQAAQPDDSPR